MAKKSLIVKEQKKLKLIQKYKTKRDELRRMIKNPNLSPSEKLQVNFKLQKLPRNSCPVRYRNRCQITGRPRGYLRRYGLSRITFRELALKGNIPGVILSSW